jgi:SNF2 family DNA or RNA helicase
MKLLGEGIFEQWYPDIWEDCLSFLLVFGPAKPPSRSMQVPFLLTPIYDYQLYASWWIWRNMAKCSLSSLLADEMGLGKVRTHPSQ